MTDKKTQHENLEEQLRDCQKEKDDFLNNWKRERADFVNYKKDESKRMEEFVKFSTMNAVLEFVDVLDAVIVVRDKLPKIDGLKEWTDGFDSSLDKIEKFLNKFGVEKIKVKDQKFDPSVHEAVEVQDKEGQNMEEIRPGYTMHGKIIRPARVKIVN